MLPKVSVEVYANAFTKSRSILSPHPVLGVSILVSVRVQHWQNVPEIKNNSNISRNPTEK